MRSGTFSVLSKSNLKCARTPFKPQQVNSAFLAIIVVVAFFSQAEEVELFESCNEDMRGFMSPIYGADEDSGCLFREKESYERTEN
jgi:hypothetical protein